MAWKQAMEGRKVVELLKSNKRFLKSIEISRALKGRKQTGRAFHVTLIFKRNKLLSIVTNNYNKTHPITDRFNYRKEGNDKEYRPSIHSELSAWLKLGKEDCGDLTFVNIRVNNNEKLGMSKPCDGCKSLLDKVGYKNFYYTNNNGELVEL